MSLLPPPPRFIRPPPPPIGIFDLKLMSQLTCSSIQQHKQQTTTSSHLIVYASTSVLLAIFLLISTLVWLLLSRRQKPSKKNYHWKAPPLPPTSIDSMFDMSTSSSSSYETISSVHTGIYLESVDTSATTFSADITGIICMECNRPYDLQSEYYYHTLSVPDVLPSITTS